MKTFLANLFKKIIPVKKTSLKENSPEQTLLEQFGPVNLPDKIFIPAMFAIDENISAAEKVKYGIQATLFADKFGWGNSSNSLMTKKLLLDEQFQIEINKLVVEFDELDGLGLITVKPSESGLLLEVMESPYGMQ